jgi:Family of unknown function (DUF6519)
MYIDATLNPLAMRDRVSRVLWQQGRVQLDSDTNEQTAALLHYLRALGADIIGAHGGLPGSFLIGRQGQQLTIGYGVYYVDGIRCENLPPSFDLFAADPATAWTPGLRWSAQRDLPFTGSPNDPDFDFEDDQGLVLYLDVWERDVTSAQDDTIREVALGGADTSARAQIVWQVRKQNFDSDELKIARDRARQFLGLAKGTFLADLDAEYLILNLLLRSSARLAVQAGESKDTNPCVISPESRYRGTENQLYRIEIHNGGDAPTFKWAVDNGSVVYPITRFGGSTITVDSLGRDARSGLTDKHWVEVVDDDTVLNAAPNPLLKVAKVDSTRMEITVEGNPVTNPVRSLSRRPILRRWDSKAQAVDMNKFVPLRSGLEVRFSRAQVPFGGYRSGDYWVVPARTIGGNVVWPVDPATGDPLPQPPHGVDHHYAPLARLDGDNLGSLRREFRSLTSPTLGAGGIVFHDLAQPPRKRKK